MSNEKFLKAQDESRRRGYTNADALRAEQRKLDDAKIDSNARKWRYEPSSRPVKE